MKQVILLLIWLFSFVLQANAVILNGQIEQNSFINERDEQTLDDSLPILNFELAPGHIFNKDKATTLLLNDFPPNEWYKIPASFAGNWKSKQVTVVCVKDEINQCVSTDLNTRQCVTKETKGYFPSIDKKYWWQFASSNYWASAEGKTIISWFFTQYTFPVNTDDKCVSVKASSIEFDTERSTGRIIKVCQREDLQVYKKVNDDLIQVNDFAREYGFEGQLRRSFHLATKLKRTDIATIRTSPTPLGHNATELFLAYLDERGMKDEYNNIVQITKPLIVHQQSDKYNIH